MNNGGQFRFVEATPSGELIAVDERGVAPDFGGTLLDGDAFDSAQLAGDVAVVNFWGSWCGPCRVETPEFQEVYDDVQDDGVSFLGINVKDGDQQARGVHRRQGHHVSEHLRPAR
ncbi:MAG: TlpA disulfide reductase family protein [Geodermatophilaceae bacterium]